MSQPATSATVRDDYNRRLTLYSSEVALLRATIRRFARRRGVTFLCSVVCFIVAYNQPAAAAVWSGVGSAILALFFALAVYQDIIQRRLEHVRSAHLLMQGRLARLDRNWPHLPACDITIPAAHRNEARDLDLLGHASLYQWVSQAYTPRGRVILRDWLLEPAAPEVIRARQASVRALVDQDPLREELTLRGKMLAASLTGPEAFVRWAEGPQLLTTRRPLLYVARLMPLCFVASMVALGSGAVAPAVAAAPAAAAVLVNVLISIVYTGRIHDIFDQISTRNGELQHYRSLFDLVATVPHATPDLAAIRDTAVDHEQGAIHRLDKLRWIMAAAGLRHAGLLSIVYVVLQLTALWDVHILAWLEKWQLPCRHLSRRWFEALGELEALASLAAVAHDQPSWCFPIIRTEGAPVVRATALGHPLLRDDVRVANDVAIGPPGTVLLVTGSNMSGKSTLLRSIGINVILAQSGGPACAAAMELTPIKIATSMRVQDSLEDGVSFFMAELQRLRAIVGQASEFAQQQDRTLLFLLDEILQGTNSVERHLAVVRVLHRLLESGAMGGVSTHDLDLAKAKEIADHCDIVHFRESLADDPQEGQIMSFDYRLHAGIATTTNALKLLKLVGLD